MRLVIQRVLEAKVLVDKKTVGEIEKGLLVLLGVKKGDTSKKADELVEKLLKLRVMADENGKMNLSIKNTSGEILIVSQFTLYADSKGGNRPSFIEAEGPEKAKEIYQYFVSKLKESRLKVATGEFGQYMKIKVQLDGPVTITLEN